MNTSKFNARELSSRKLWQLVKTESIEEINARELSEAVAELAKRRHVLENSKEINQLGEQKPS